MLTRLQAILCLAFASLVVMFPVVIYSQDLMSKAEADKHRQEKVKAFYESGSQKAKAASQALARQEKNANELVVASLSDLEAAIELDSEYTMAYIKRASLMVVAEDFQGAVKEYERLKKVYESKGEMERVNMVEREIQRVLKEYRHNLNIQISQE